MAYAYAMKEKGKSNREKLRWLAFDHHGIVTIDQAAAVGVPAVELCKLAARARARQPELALVNPRTIKVATHRRVRTKLPATIELIHGVTTDAVEVVDGLATMPLKDVLLACRGRVMRERIAEATHTALARELIDEHDAAEVLQRLEPVST